MLIYIFFSVKNKYICIIICKCLHTNQNIDYYYTTLYYNSCVSFIISESLYINKNIFWMNKILIHFFSTKNKYKYVITCKPLFTNQSINYYYIILYYNGCVSLIISECLYTNKNILWINKTLIHFKCYINIFIHCQK